jgi:dihydropyrimidinase
MLSHDRTTDVFHVAEVFCVIVRCQSIDMEPCVHQADESAATASEGAEVRRVVGVRVGRNEPLTGRLETIVDNAAVVSSHAVRREDIGIRDGRIVALGDLSHAEATTRIDATGLLALPGLIDAHVHPTYLDDPRDCSIGAVCGGITTMLFFAYAKKGESLTSAVSDLQDAALGSSLLDFGLHATLFDVDAQADQIPDVAATGVRTFKLFLAYAAQGWMSDDFALARVMRQVSLVDGLLLAHCENGAAIDVLERQASIDDLDGPLVLNRTRPALLEAEAVNRLITFGEVFSCPVFVVHVTSREALEVVRRARARGCAVAAETCPHYLALTERAVDDWRSLAKIGPPLRTERDRQSLWSGLQDRTLQTIGSDHVPKKTLAMADRPLLEAEFGAPAIETMLAVVYDRGVAQGKIEVTRLVELMSENPARIFGLWPKKGAIDLGADADVVLWDPAGTTVIAADKLHTRSGYSLYDGQQLRGKHVVTLARGHVMAQEGDLTDDGRLGRFLPTMLGDLLRSDVPRSRPGSSPSVF